MAEHQQMQQPHQGQQMTAQILNVQGGVATLDEPVPVQIMMPATVVMEEHHQPQEHHQVPQHVQEMHEVVQEAVGATTQGTPPEDPKITNKKELSKQWKSLCKRAKQWCSMHDDSVPNFVMMYLDENRLVWEGPDHMESFISDESVISAFLRTAALSESLIGMEKRGADDTQDISHPAKKQKKAVDTADESQKAVDDEDDVLSAILEKREPEDQDAEQVEGAGGDEKKADVDPGLSQGTDTDQPSQSTSEGQSQGGEGDVLSQVIESVIKDWAPGQGPPPTSQDEGGDASGAKMKVLIYDHLTTERGGNLSSTCYVCYKQFPCLRSLEAHMKLHPDHINGSAWRGKKKWKMHTCNVCWKNFYLKANFINHKHTQTHKLNVSRKRRMKAHGHVSTGIPSAGPHKCCHCGKEYKQMYKLRNHLNSVHLGLRPHGCRHCSSKFVHRGDLNRHTKIFHGETIRQMTVNNDGRLVLAEERKHACRVCERRFRSKGDLVRHVRIHTGEKPFNCLHCDRAFAHKSDLNKHMRIHTGEKPYNCPHCGRAFKDLGNMKAHVRTHTKEQFACQICQAQFTTAKDLRAHHWTHAGAASPAAVIRPRVQSAVTNQWSQMEVTAQHQVPVNVATSLQAAIEQVEEPVPSVEPILVTACNLTIDTETFNQLLHQTQTSQ